MRRQLLVGVRSGRTRLRLRPVRVSGAWGCDGTPAIGVTRPNLDLGGPLPEDATVKRGGMLSFLARSRIYVNGRELAQTEAQWLAQVLLQGGAVLWAGRYWLDAQGNFATGLATVRVDQPVAPEIWQEAVETAGYQLVQPEAPDAGRQPVGPSAQERANRAEQEEEAHRRLWGRRLALVALPALFLLSTMLYHDVAMTSPGIRMAQFLIATPVQFYIGWPFIREAARRARHFSANMDTLIAMGTLAAYLFSVFQIAIGAHDLYFEAQVVIIAFIVFMQEGQRRIPVQYAKRVVGRRMAGGGSTYLPLRVNMAGVIPVIFAASLMAFPPTVGELSQASWARDFSAFFSPNGAAYLIGESFFIIIFTYFYTAVTFNPVEQADNLKKYGGFIPGVRPGRPTAEFLDRILARLTFPGALYLAAVAALPTILINQTAANFYFGGTSILIVVGVALDTMKQLEAQLMMRNYEGFLK